MDLSVIELFRAQSDGFPTKTFRDQQECEQSCAMYYFPLTGLPPDQLYELKETEFVNDQLQPRLMREKHIKYLRSGLRRLPHGFVALDASHPWIIYWILNGLDLLGENLDPYADQAIGTIRHYWSPLNAGGFGGAPMQFGHTATTYASSLALALLGTPEAYEVVDRQALYKFFCSRKDHASGAFSAHDGGEVDVRVTYCVISIASLFGILTEELKAGVVDYITSCQTYEGGFGGEPGNEAHGGYSFCAVAALYILDSVDKMQDLEAFVFWLINRQMPFEGGYQGRTNKLVDGCYSFWQGSLPALVDSALRKKFGNENVVFQSHREQLQKYIIQCCQQLDGGLRDKPGKPRDHYHSCYCLAGLSVAQHGNGKEEPVVFGDPENLVGQVHPAYNVAVDKVERMKQYFAEKTFKPEE